MKSKESKISSNNKIMEIGFMILLLGDILIYWNFIFQLGESYIN